MVVDSFISLILIFFIQYYFNLFDELFFDILN